MRNLKTIKTIIAGLSVLLSFSATAGEFSKIDAAVREELQNFFGVSYSQISELNVVKNLSTHKSCLLTVTALVQQDDEWGQSFKTWSCVKRIAGDVTTAYDSVVIKFEPDKDIITEE